MLAEGGPLVVDTGKHTGPLADDKFVVREPGSEERIWWGKVNQPLEPESFERLREKVAAYLGARDLYVVDAFAGADPAHRLALRVVTPSAYHALFARTMFIPPSDGRARRVRARRGRPARARRSRPTRRATARARGTFIALHPTRRRGADRRHLLRRARSRSRSSR